jgi:hypothetical protein
VAEQAAEEQLIHPQGIKFKLCWKQYGGFRPILPGRVIIFKFIPQPGEDLRKKNYIIFLP